MLPTTIGPYQIQRELGRGGMGEVYLAHDSRLDRQVAIKALPAHLAADPDRLARFQREAKVLASLNHPGVGAIYGLEESGGHRYLVLECIEGDTLADRLVNGPIPVDEALSVARQMAEALEAAHDKGVIHRDLKPANVMVSGEGVVKVLDFGLARTAEGSPSSLSHPSAPDSPTMSVHSPTIPGAIMGTAGYMSPEQARGKPVDKRSDIFSFGCVLYEMLTGAGPFPGETVTDSLGAILHREPDWSLLPRGTPARVRELLRSCLAKERRNRLHDIGDARIELERAVAGHEWTEAHGQEASGSGVFRPAAMVMGAAAMFGTGWLLAGRFTKAPAPTTASAQSFHVSASVPAKPSLSYVIGIAPDARFVVYKAWSPLEPDSTKPGGMLMVRALDRNETTPVPGTEGVMEASLSGDGRWLAFAAMRDRAGTRLSLKKIALDNGRPVGTPEILCELPVGTGLSLCWSSEREIVVALQWEEKILAVPAAGGEARVVLDEGKSKGVDTWGETRPAVPGKSIFASRWAVVDGVFKERTEVVDLATGSRTPLLQNAGGITLLPGGYMVARRNQNTLVAARMDPASLQFIGEPVTVWSGMLRNSFFVSPSGTLAMTADTADFSGRKLAWVDEQGKVEPLALPARPYATITISPDGGRVATNLEPQDAAELPTDIWIQDLSRRTRFRVPTEGPVIAFVWSGDGQKIAYSSVSGDEFTVWYRPADGSGESVKMYAGPTARMLLFPAEWSRDGKVLALQQVDLGTGNSDIIMLEQTPGATTWTAKPYLSSAAGEDSLRFSPDGKWVRFASDESGQRQFYVQRFSGAGSGAEDAKSGRRAISGGGAATASWWSADGKEIRYIDNEGQVMSVQVQTEPSLTTAEPKLLYSIKDLKTRDVAFAPDGQLMVVLQSENEQPTKIDLVLNFLEEIRAKVNAGK